MLDEVAAVSRPGAAKLPVDHRSARYATVTFGGGRSALLDHTEHRGRVWADVLESLQESRQAAYVEIERRDVSSNETRTEVSASVLRSVRATESRSLAALCGDIERRHLEAI